jgi:hypothetical protein
VVDEKKDIRMTKEQNDRLVVAWELIAKSLEGLHEEVKRAGKRYWPEPGQQREVIFSRVPTEEDKIRERQGTSVPIEQWLRNLPEHDDEDPRIIGERSRQWLKDHPSEKEKVVDASPESAGEQDTTSPQEDKGKA